MFGKWAWRRRSFSIQLSHLIYVRFSWKVLPLLLSQSAHVARLDSRLAWPPYSRTGQTLWSDQRLREAFLDNNITTTGNVYEKNNNTSPKY